MAANSSIEWTDASWAPMTGCTKVSPGCDHCYADGIAHRFAGTKAWPNGFGVTLRPERLDIPLRWRKPRKIFVCSTGDLFHAQVPDEYIAHVFAVMQSCAAHTFQVLTKRHSRMRSLLTSESFWDAVTDFGSIVMSQRPSRAQLWPDHGRKHGYLPNVWLGVSAESQRWAETRIPVLLDTPAAVRFVSIEPLLAPLKLWTSWLHPVMRPGADPAVGRRVGRANGVNFLDWVIVGGESGQRARPMNPRWVRELRDQCVTAKVPFLFKQWGEWGPAPWKIERQPDEFTLDYKARAESLCATHAFTGGLYQDDSGEEVENFTKLGHQPWSSERDDEAPPFAEGMRRWGKKTAGRELDGRTWDQFPQAVG